MPQKQITVPRGTPDPVAFLIDNGWTAVELAVAWGYKNSSAIDKLKTATNVPRYRHAEKMAVTFGWKSAGEVIDFYAGRRAARKSGAPKRAAAVGGR